MTKMTKEQKERLEGKTKKGKEVYFKDKRTGKPTLWGIVEDEVFVMVNDYKHLLQRIKCATNKLSSNGSNSYWDGSEYGYRTGYYTYDKNYKKICWGQFTQFLTQKEYSELLQKAKAKGWIFN